MAIPALHNTLGAAYIGNILAACLYGLTTLQTFIYYNRSPKDSAVLKTLVAMLWFLDTLHLALISHTVYEYTVTDFGNFIALLEPTWSVLAQVIVTGVSDGIVRGIFCYRIWMLSNQHIPTLAGLASAALLAFGKCLRSRSSDSGPPRLSTCRKFRGFCILGCQRYCCQISSYLPRCACFWPSDGVTSREPMASSVTSSCIASTHAF
ncbi:hypothetical protein L226DRAFT_241453 [Lentinus tigrinus ALCF2SS1-7]|uniref:uncharacterized protein n=1 Tax=Lentinus tigrinus ALCF2SS1-7 TaxID=1328758 RepID=UPI001165F41D|nr:hypothetical protein L226DRAFT_241453 [Lentinus tigrinus ALCF2SS1-7]